MELFQLKKSISTLNEQEAKSLLHLLLIRSEYGDFPEFVRSVKETLMKRMETPAGKNVHTVHIVFGSSAAGSLRYAFQDTPYEQTEEIIEVPDNLAEGPIHHLHTAEGFERRYQWLKENYRWEKDQAEWYKNNMQQAFEKISSIPPEQRVVIWTGENASEGTGLRFSLYLLKEKTNEMSVLNTYDAYHKFYNGMHEDFPRHTGELSPEQLLLFYELGELEELTEEQRQAYAKEGEECLHSDAVLRTYNKGQIFGAENHRDDALIIGKMKNLQGNKKFIKAARVIGEVLGHLDQYTSDEWIEYRLRQLIAQGKVEYQGELRAMRFYEVKLKEAFVQ
ncbi:DUF1835 domain-containing protein [Ureibacillus suwonensis]|uniref:DUF1835 domain-containing protein n=1 Tax=Ureibacillus suwonensis TaxID=313007 RepID=A0ABW0REL4_9BACL